MMLVAVELQIAYDNLHNSVPKDISNIMKDATSNFKNIYDVRQAIKVGERFPEFRLQDVHGQEKTNADLPGRLLISFYRGGWCPYCNVELRALQKYLGDFKARGVTLVAVSPELPDRSLTTKERHDLTFTVLSDAGNKLAKQLGIVFQQPSSMRTVLEFASIDLKAQNGDDSLQVPIPATFLVDERGILRNSSISADYTTRLEPTEALRWIDAL
jgi:peroxiredoxin